MQFDLPKRPLFLSTTLLLVCFFVFLFLYKQINYDNNLAEKTETEWQIEASRRDKIKSLDNSIKIIATEKKELETHFAKSSDIVPFLDTIEKLAPEVGAKAEVTSVDTPENSTGLMVGMKVSGSFESIYKFLMLLESSPYELKFISVDIQNMVDATKKVSFWDAILKIELLTFEKQ